MNRPRGNRTATAEIAKRRQRVIAKAREGKTQNAIAEEVGASLRTIARDFEALARDFQSTTSDQNLEFRRTQLAAFELIERSLVDGHIDSETANAWRGVRGEISKLLGLNAPTKSIVGHVSNESSPMFLKFKKACIGLTDDQLDEVYAFATNLKREPRTVVRDASWFPPVRPKLTEGVDDGE